MALSAVEEAQTRLLLDKIAALQSLAESEPTIISKLGAQKVNLSQLPVATAAASDDLLIVRQGTQDKAITFSAVKSGIADGGVLAVNNLSELVNKQTAFNNIKQPATELVTGVVELATDAEAQAGTDFVRAVHPRGMFAAIGAFLTGKKATQAQVDAGTDDVNFVTSLKMRFGFGLVHNATTQAGYIRLPSFLGRLTLQWGRNTFSSTTVNAGETITSTNIVYPIAFTELYQVGGWPTISGSSGLESLEHTHAFDIFNLTNLQWTAMRQRGTNTTQTEVIAFRWFAIGKA